MRPDIRTLDDLIDFARTANLPLDDMRFALGRDMGTQPKWFYIYQEPTTDAWIVAKNKADGKAAIRYYGDNEAEAVRIILSKMESEANARGLTLWPDEKPDYVPPPEKARPAYRPSPAMRSDIDPWDVPENKTDEPRVPRQCRNRTGNRRAIRLITIMTVAIILTAFLAIAISGISGAVRHSGHRPVYDESYDVPEPWYHWHFDFSPDYNDGYHGHEWNDSYNYEYDYGYNHSEWGYDDGRDDNDGWNYDDDWDSGYDDWGWDYDDSNWDSDWGYDDSDWDSDWDSWDYDSSDWDSDW